MANDKYVKLIKQYSEDGGNTWYDSNPPEYKRGDLIETDSPDCGAAVLQYRWFAKGEDYYNCEGYNKYYKEWYQYSYNGKDWFDVEPEQTRTGSLIEQNSIDCDYGIEWIPVEDQYICKEYITDPIYQYNISPDEFICEGYDKYEKLVYQVSTDGGYTWENVVPEQTKQGDLIEENSEDCGYKVWKQVEGEYYCDKYRSYYIQVEKLQAYHKNGTPFEPAEYKMGEPLWDTRWTNKKSCETNKVTYGEALEKGKVLYYDLINNKLVIDKPYVNEKFIPIGIGIVPEEHNLYGDNSISFIGFEVIEGRIWNQYYELTEIKCPINDPMKVPVYSEDEFANMSKTPLKTVDIFEYEENTFNYTPDKQYTYDTVVELNLIREFRVPKQTSYSSFGLMSNEYDDKTSYILYQGGGVALPSMYNSDNSINEDVDRNGTIFEKKCGLEDTKKLYNLSKYDDPNFGDSQAALSAHNVRYHGTELGDWYIPSITEACYIINRLSDISEIFSYLSKHYGIAKEEHLNLTDPFINTCYYYGKDGLRDTTIENGIQKTYINELQIGIQSQVCQLDRSTIASPTYSIPLIRVKPDGTIIR